MPSGTHPNRIPRLVEPATLPDWTRARIGGGKIEGRVWGINAAKNSKLSGLTARHFGLSSVEIINQLGNIGSIHAKLWIISLISRQKSHMQGFQRFSQPRGKISNISPFHFNGKLMYVVPTCCASQKGADQSFELNNIWLCHFTSLSLGLL